MPNSYKEEQLNYKNMRRAPAPDAPPKSVPKRKPKNWVVQWRGYQSRHDWRALHKSASKADCLIWIEKWKRSIPNSFHNYEFQIVSPEGDITPYIREIH